MSGKPLRAGLASKAAAAAAAKRQREVELREVEGVIRTSPRRQKRQKNVVPPSRGSIQDEDDVPSSQQIAQSQSLLSPEVATESQESIGVTLSMVAVPVESQLTKATDFPSDSSDVSSGNKSSGNENEVESLDVGGAAASVNNLFGGDDDFDAVEAAMADGLDDLNDYSSDRFSLNERRHFYMDRLSISSQNRIAVEFVYMLEAETLTRGSGTVGRGDVKQLCHSKYIELIRQIPANHFGEFGLREAMTERYYGAKKGGASGFYTKVLDTKTKVQAVTRAIDGIGTPLSKIPSGRGLTDVRQQFILKDYKAVMGAVSVCLRFMPLIDFHSNTNCN